MSVEPPTHALCFRGTLELGHFIWHGGARSSGQLNIGWTGGFDTPLGGCGDHRTGWTRVQSPDWLTPDVRRPWAAVAAIRREGPCRPATFAPLDGLKSPDLGEISPKGVIVQHPTVSCKELRESHDNFGFRSLQLAKNKWLRTHTTVLGSARLGSARLGSARLGSARLGSG